MTLTEKELANLNEVAVETYHRNLDLYLAKPSRLAVLYGSKFREADVKAQAHVVCNTAANLIGLPSVVVLVGDVEIFQVACSDDYPLEEIIFEHGALAASFCKFTVNEKLPFKVESATQHQLVCYSEAVTGPLGLRAYLGVPIIVRDEAIGSLCVWGPQEHEFSTLDVEILVNLAAVLVALEAGRRSAIA